MTDRGFVLLRRRNGFQAIGALGLALGLAACGQVAVNPSGTGDVTLVAAEGPNGQTLLSDSLTSGELGDEYIGDAIGTELERMLHRPCHSSDGLDAGMESYSVCLGANGQPLLVDLSTPQSAGAEPYATRYWFRDSGALYAVETDTSLGMTRSVLVEDGKTLVYMDEQRELTTLVDGDRWQELTRQADQTLTDFYSYRDSFAEAEQTGVNSGPPVAVVKLPRTGGDFNHRWATVVVPQPSTAVSAEGGAMRWYDLHLATMVALTADQFCGSPSARGAYFNYEADGGSLFMGQYFIDCGSARELMAVFGQERHTWVVLEEVHGTDIIHQYVPALSDAVMPEFRRQGVDFFVPECSAHHCPGDRI